MLLKSISHLVLTGLVTISSPVSSEAYHADLAGKNIQEIGVLEEPRCTSPRVRTEWRRMPPAQKTSYISAPKCLLNKPPLESPNDIPAVTNRFEDFAATHIVQCPDVHFVGAFYPYHRWLLWNYEKALQDCGYVGGHPYWDWTLDVANEQVFLSSPIFDPYTGFGGNGAYAPHEDVDIVVDTGTVPRFPEAFTLAELDRSGGGCILNGPFKGLTTQLGPGSNIQRLGSYCVGRDLSWISLARMSSQQNVTDSMSLRDYGWWDRVTELSIHAGGHWAIGGGDTAMTDVAVAPIDPLFWLHHANLDRAWWSWQTRNLAEREKDISGPLSGWDYDNQKSGNITMNDTVHIGVTKKLESRVADLMHIQKGALCYDYDQLY